MSEEKGWVGFDLDGTLARGHGLTIGPPEPAMVALLQSYRAQGMEVRIVTARAEGHRAEVEAWCEKNLGFVPRVTDRKDYSMVALYDDRAKQVERGVVLEDAMRRMQLGMRKLAVAVRELEGVLGEGSESWQEIQAALREPDVAPFIR